MLISVPPVAGEEARQDRLAQERDRSGVQIQLALDILNRNLSRRPYDGGPGVVNKDGNTVVGMQCGSRPFADLRVS